MRCIYLFRLHVVFWDAAFPVRGRKRAWRRNKYIIHPMACADPHPSAAMSVVDLVNENTCLAWSQATQLGRFSTSAIVVTLDMLKQVCWPLRLAELM